MIVRGRRRALLREVATEWGIYQAGWDVEVLSGEAGGFVVCLDADGHSPSLVCHTATVQSADLFVWPADIEHGTDLGHSRHRIHMESPCERCKTHYISTKRAQRLRTGKQAGVKVPFDFLGTLLQGAPLDAWSEAERLWGKQTVDALLDAA